MHLQSALWRSVASLATLSAVVANIIYNDGLCDLTMYEVDLWRGFFVESQATFDALLGNCTTIIGSLFISPNYTGSFIMNNVTNMTGDLGTIGYVTEDYTTEESVANKPSPFLTSLQADNLVWLTELLLEGVPALTSISMAKLDTVSSLIVYSNPTMSLSFPRLRNSSEIRIQGGYSSVNFDQLANVDHSMSIGTTNDSSYHGWENYLKRNPKHSSPIDIKLPSLINATYIEIWGNISSLYMPSLTTSVWPELHNPQLLYHKSGIFINNYALKLLNLSLPKLRDATSIIISGGIGSVALSALTNFTGEYHVFASKRNHSRSLAMNLDPLHEAGSISFFGNIKSVNISTIQSIKSLSVSSDIPIDCGKLGVEYARIKNAIQTNKDQLSGLGFQCSFTPQPKKHLSKGAKIGIGLGVAIPGWALLTWLMILRINKKRKLEENKLPGYHMASLDPVPKYPHTSPPEEGMEGGENGSPATSAHEESRGSLNPPAYDASSGQARDNEGGQTREARTEQHNVN